MWTHWIASKSIALSKNECKGKGGCKSASNECKGKNSCKGKGGCNSDMGDKKDEHKKG